MSGLTLYETLRILTPGVLGLLVADIVLRLSFGPHPARADGGVGGLVQAIETPVVWLAGSLFLGLLLYLIDLPMKTRLYDEGDPGRGFRLPSATLRSLLKDEYLRKRSLGLYFLLSDRYLPPELHRRIYLFGSLYRIYVDLRILLGAGLVAGVLAGSFVAARRPAFDPWPQVTFEAFITPILVLLLVLLVGLYGVFVHRKSVQQKHPDARTEYRRRVIDDVRSSWRVWILMLILGLFGAVIVRFAPIPALAILFAMAHFILWLWVELGPPKRKAGIRHRTFSWLHMVKDDVHYSPFQRLICDICLFFPWLLAAAALSFNIGAGPGAVGGWAILAVPCTTIMSAHKHEVRLLYSFEDQSLYLQMHRREIEQIDRTGQLPDQWR